MGLQVSLNTKMLVMRKYHTHPSILKIKENSMVENKFEFVDMTSAEIEADIKKLIKKKATMENDTPVKILIGSNDIVGHYLSDIYNNPKNSETYPSVNFLGIPLCHIRNVYTSYFCRKQLKYY